MKVLVVGLGSIGLRHARNLKALGIDQIIGCDPKMDRRLAFSAEISDNAFVVLSAALEQSPDLVIIASPNRLHISQALLAAQRGAHLMIEKPLGSDLKGLLELKREVARQSLFCHIGSNWKFYPAFSAMKTILEKATIGPLAGIQVLAGHWLPDWHPERDYRQEYSARHDLGGGIILDTHEIDCMAWLCGPVTSSMGLSAQTGFLETSTEDVAAIALKFLGGVIGTLQIDYIQRVPRRRYNICGRDGTLEWELGEPLKLYKADQGEWVDIPGTLEADYNKMYLLQMQNVLSGVRNGGVPVTSLEHAENVLSTQLNLRDNAS